MLWHMLVVDVEGTLKQVTAKVKAKVMAKL